MSLSNPVPEITKGGLNTVITKIHFNRFLDPKKKDHYETSTRLKGLEISVNEGQLIRYCNHCIWLVIMLPEINYSYFAV